MVKTLIKDLPLLERPRERLLKYGVNNLSNEELLSIVLKTGSKNMSVKELSNNLLKEVGDVTNFKDISINKIIKIKGIGEVKAITLLASIEFGKRVYEEKEEKYIKLDSSKDIYEYIKKDLKYKKQEYFYCLYLDNKKNLIEKKLLFIGTLNNASVHPREIFKYAYIFSATSIIYIHNHPSGDVIPSNDDLSLTKKLVDKLNNNQQINESDVIIILNFGEGNCFYKCLSQFYLNK